ncbi:DUF1697 domain-containing protein [Paenibacillus koleovorans]|uniref:DUF1697 domain-containing protein n=1 Tax=Paenibacillus koleovorans TaxID=121608 RepID=UPI000FD8F689|nr:DUF1697 domain-containing protein [Paenibacillus koleovorans]
MIYIALLRGVNVGGNNKLKMADLKRSLESIGFKRVQTYIQSGNVLFESDESHLPKEDARSLEARMEEHIRTEYGITTRVILRSADEWERIVTACPFDEEAIAAAHSLHVTLLGGSPTERELELLRSVEGLGDDYRLIGLELYVLYGKSVLDSKLSVVLQKFKTPSSARNWNTMQKLLEMARAMR